MILVYEILNNIIHKNIDFQTSFISFIYNNIIPKLSIYSCYTLYIHFLHIFLYNKKKIEKENKAFSIIPIL